MSVNKHIAPMPSPLAPTGFPNEQIGDTKIGDRANRFILFLLQCRGIVPV